MGLVVLKRQAWRGRKLSGRQAKTRKPHATTKIEATLSSIKHNKATVTGSVGPETPHTTMSTMSTISQATKPSMAARHVFNIPELLENILSHLGPRDLLVVQRTALSFRHTVQGSLRLRRKAFLEPDWTLQTASQSYLVRNRMGNRPENNRMLQRAFPGCYPTITLVIVPEDRRHLRGKSDATALQQMSYAQGARGMGSSPEDTSEEWSWDVCISFPADSRRDLSDAVLRPEASWRRMYLSQPPCKELYLVRRWKRSSEPALVREGGITMGDFYDEVTQRGKDNKWQQSYTSGDCDWHFEGNIQCDSFPI